LFVEVTHMLVFFFTDIEGSTRLWEEHTDYMGEVIARHDAILQQQIAQSGGRITKHTGDGVTAAFEGGGPVACALEAQKRFAAEDWGAIGELRIRMGLHAGKAEFQKSAGTPAGDYFGPAVNATARVMSAAWGGQVVLTPEVTQASPLPPGATLRDLGQHLLKNVSAPQQLYQLDHPQLPWLEFPPPRTISGQSIRQAVDQRGSQLASLDPTGMAVGLLTAILLPALQGELDPESGALEGNLGVLGDLGAGTLRAFTAQFAGQLRARQEVGESPGLPEIQVLLDRELLAQWQAGGETAAALRADASRLLQAVHGVEATMSAATQEVREALARGLAELADHFAEFHWMLVGVQDTLAEMRARQALQLALQREQLDLQRQQLVKTNLLLRRQRVGPALAELTVEGEVEEPPPADVPCPFKGLAAFEAEDAEYFFGREELVAELTARLAGTRFLAVVGPSGSGKSSLVRAGLLPAVWDGAVPGSEAWPTLVITPGAHPLNELAVRLSLWCDDRPASLLRDLEADPRAADLAIRNGLSDQPGEVKLLLVVDQFEEIFALCRDEGERRRFIEALLYAVEAEDGRTIVVPTIRADFYGRCADYPQLAARMSDGLLVGPMSEDELRAAIEHPAMVAGLRLEPGLSERILDDVAGEPGALPLLSHALLETFARRRGAQLTLSGYAESGGVAGAIAQTADTVFGQFSPQEQAIARNIFLRLTELGKEGAQDTRRRVAPRELVRTPEEAPAVQAVLKTLADARLITTGGGPVLSGAEGTVEVAHEALIREWPTLRGWLDEDREGLRIHRHLTEAAAEWERLEREPGELYRGARLATAGEWLAEHADLPNPLERDFLAASQELARSEEAERHRRRQRTIVGLVTALAITLILAMLAVQQSQRARTEEQKALQQAGILLASQAEAELEAGYGDLAVLLALEALEHYPYTAQAEHALGQAVSYSRALQGHTAHQGAVTSVSWSPDGTQVATSSTDNSVHVWDAASGEELWVVDLPEGITGNIYDYALAVKWSPDGEHLLTVAGDRFLLGSQDYDLLLWDASPRGVDEADREPLMSVEIPNQAEPEQGEGSVTTLGVHYGTGAAADFAPQSGRLATLGGDDSVVIWDAHLQEQELALTGHANDVNAVAWSPDETRLATASEDATARIWDAQDGEVRMVLEGNEGAVNHVAWSPDGTQLATAGDDGTVRIWNTAPAAESGTAGELLGTLEPEAGIVWSLAWSTDGSYLATGTDDGRVRIWSVPGGEIMADLGGHNDFVAHLAWSPVDDRLASAGADGVARVWNAAPSTAAQALPYWTVSDLTWSSDGHYLALPTGDTGYGTGEPGRLAVWDVAAAQPITQKLDTDFNYIWFEADYSPDDRLLMLGGLSSWPEGIFDLDTRHVLDAQTGREVQSFTVTDGSWIRSCGWSPDGAQVATGTAAGILYLWDVQTGELLNTLAGHEAEKMVNYVKWSPDGTRIATACDDGTARVWDATTGETLLVLAHEAPTFVWSAVWSPDGSRLLTTSGGDDIGAEDNTVRIWDANSGEELLVLRGHGSQVVVGDWSPDGRRIVSTSSDSTTRIWDAESGEELLTLSTPAVYCPFAHWSPDGKYVAVGMETTPAEIWRVWQSTEELVDYARESYVFRELTDAERERFGLAPE
jgi:WD40 repeat protein/class 3 adenylate cyclase